MCVKPHVLLGSLSGVIMVMCMVFCIILSSTVVSANFRKFSILSGLKAENASWSEMRAADNDVECCLLCDSHSACIAANTANGVCELVGEGKVEMKTMQGWTSYFKVLEDRIDGQLVPPVTQSTRHHSRVCAICGIANLALDGNTDSNYYHGSCSSTDSWDYDNWWKVDFQSIYLVSGVVICNRSGVNYRRLRGLRLYVSVSESQLNDPAALCAAYDGPPASSSDNPVRINCNKPMLGRFLKIHKIAPTDPVEPLTLCEVEIVKGS